jgi:hypothetical protein
MVSEIYPVAVKVHAMQIAFNHVLIYPDLRDELETIIRDQMDHNTAGFYVRGKMILKQMEKLESQG